MKIFIAGTFDHLHVGHQALLWRSIKKYPQAQFLIMVARDRTVKNIKSRLPINTEDQRLKRLKQEFSEFPQVTVELGRLDANFWASLESFRPEKIILGYDQHLPTALEKTLEEKSIALERQTPFYPKYFKSSKFKGSHL